MYGSATVKKVVAAWLTMCMLLSSMSMTAITVSADEQVNNVTDGYLVFKGFAMQEGNNNKMQALVDIYVDNVNATGIGFTLEYDRRYLEPSDFVSNNPTVETTEAFKPNGTIFTNEYPAKYGLFSEIDNESDEQGFIEMNITPTDGATGEWYGTGMVYDPEPQERTYVKSDGETLWGTLSFVVHDSIEVCNMTEDELSTILHLSREDDGTELAYTAYINEGSITEFYGPKLPVKWQVSSDLKSVTPNQESSTVTAYSLYQRAKTGTLQDLVAYLNQTLYGITEHYGNGVRNSDARIKWRLDSISVVDENDDPVDNTNYDPKGGHTYKITQNYLNNPDYAVTVSVKVSTSEITGFNYDRRTITYNPTAPSDWSELLLPPVITPVITGTDYMYIPPSESPDGYTPTANPEPTWNPEVWTPSNLSPFVGPTPPVSAEYKHEYDKILLSVDSPTATPIPWLTVPTGFDWKITAIRNWIDDSEVLPPKGGDDDNPTITAEVNRVSGDLIITISKEAFGTDWIPEAAGGPNTTEFKIYLPNGIVLSTKDNPDFVKADSFGGDGSAVVTVSSASSYGTGSPDTLVNSRELIQSIINLGSTDFTISAKPASGKVSGVESNNVPFKFEPRVNYYLPDESISDPKSRKVVEKDYSGIAASSFQVYEDQKLTDISCFVHFPDSTIEIKYEGEYGYQKPFVNPSDPNSAILKYAKVDSWSWEYLNGDDPSTTGADESKLPASGQDIYLVGHLSDYSYVPAGYVQNPDDVYLKIKVSVLHKIVETPTPTPTENPGPTDDPGPTDEPTPTPTAVPTDEIRISTRIQADASENGKIGTGPEVELNKKTFEYDRKQVGYMPADVQEQVYKVENTGSNNLSDLLVRMDTIKYTPEGGTEQDYTDYPFDIGYDRLYSRVEDTSAPGTYIITSDITEINSGEEAYLNIRTKRPLAAGTYTARVTISNHTGDLDYFDLKFIVTSKPVYKVIVDNSALSGAGYGYLTTPSGGVASSTYEEEEKVYLQAVITDSGYGFDRWTNPSGEGIIFTDDDDGTVGDEKQLATSFEMPVPNNNADVTVEPEFSESIDVWIRLSDLRSYDDGAATPNDLRRTTDFAVIPYSSTTYDYAVIASNTVDKNYVEFDIKDTLADDLTIELKYNGATLNTETPVADTDNHTVTYKSELFDLTDGPDIVEITTSYTDPVTSTVHSKTYTLTIYRRAAANVDLKYGNSPMGLIYRSFPSTGDTRANAKAHFEANHTFAAFDENGDYDKQYTPSLAATTYGTYYSTDAWGTETNYDNNEYAIFVYQGEAFVDPGYSDLKYMDNTTDVPDEEVTRTIEGLYTYETGANGIMDDLVNATGPTNMVLPEHGTTDVLINDLVSKKIRPGVYKLVYSFENRYGQTTFERPLIILDDKGDMNMDGTLGQTDSDALYQRLNNDIYKTAISDDSEAWKRLYSYRIGDVSEDRNVNSVDANAVLGKTNSTYTYTEYYEKLPAAVPVPAAPTMPADATVSPAASPPEKKATLKLDYLGNASLGTEPIAPGLKESNAYPAGQTAEDDAFKALLSVVWVGIGIKDVSDLTYFKDGLYSVDLAIDYDPQIFLPCDDVGRLEGETGFDYGAMIERTNFDSTAGTFDKTLWRNGELYAQSLQRELDLDTSGRYKTVFVTIKSSDENALRLQDMPDGTTDEVYLLRLPFRLIKYPEDGYTGNALQINTTEQTFVLGGTKDGVTNSASWEGVLDKTTEVNNAKNHFDGPETVDIFGTNGVFYLTGKITGWNPSKPFVLEFFKTTNTGETVDYTYTSDDHDAADNYLYGSLTNTLRGEVEWNFKVPLSNLFEYTARVKKQSHITYPEFSITTPGAAGTDVPIDQIDMIVGDINSDGQVKIPDRVSLMRFFDQHRPWQLYTDRFEAADLNGDSKVNLFDLNLLKQNYDKAYPKPTATPIEGGGG